jgi:hypothetical protein
MNSDEQGALVRTWDIEQVYGSWGRFLKLVLIFHFKFLHVRPDPCSAARLAVFRVRYPRLGLMGESIVAVEA